MLAGGQPVRLAALFAVFTLGYLCYLLRNDGLETTPTIVRNDTEENLKNYLVYGPYCRIPNLNPFESTISSYVTPTKPVICSELPLLSKIFRRHNRHVLSIDENGFSKYRKAKKQVKCCYSKIIRITEQPNKYDSDADKIYEVGSCEHFAKEIILPEDIEFLLVSCKSNEKIFYSNAHAIVPKKSSILQRAKDDTDLNVILIGIDSVSRLNLRRTMPKALTYFHSHNWHELQGYNKIADNTFPNLMAILSGKRVEQLGTCMLENMKQDVCPIIWKNFKKKGYATAYAEDVPFLATFNYKKAGFVQQPTDYYMRPFMLAIHTNLNTKNKDGLPVCIGPQSAADYIFDYAKDFVTTYKNHRYFGIFWLNSFSHNSVNAPGALDSRLKKFLTDLEDTQVFNNSLVAIFSDHGIRFGPIRNTFLGFSEERLPFFFLHLPSWFSKKYPGKLENLTKNQNRLTSPFDIYSTLKELLKELGQPEGCPACQSIFSEIPATRTCEDAGIDPHWCMCPKFQQLPVNNTVVIIAGQFLYERVLNRTNELMKRDKIEKNLCEKRKFGKIVRAHLRQPWDMIESNEKSILLILETYPFGLFEATIKITTTSQGYSFEILGFISRLDSYFSTTKCLPSHSTNLQFYCHCYDS